MPREAPRTVTVDAEDVRREIDRALDHLLSAVPKDQRSEVTEKILLRLRPTTAGGGEPRFVAPAIWKTAYAATIFEVRRHGGRPAAGADAGAAAQGAPPGHRLGLAIFECLQGLAPSRRVAAVLHLQGHTEREIATLLGLTKRKSGNVVHRAVEALRAGLEAKGVRP